MGLSLPRAARQRCSARAAGRLIVATLGLAWLSAALAASAPVALTAADVSLYLTVIRAAAGRVQHPTEQDRAAERLAAQSTERQRAAYADFQRRFQGKTPSAEDIQALKTSDPTAEAIAAQKLTRALHARPDVVVAEERQVDLKRYVEVQRTIERIVVIDNEAGEVHEHGHDRDRDPDKDSEAGHPPGKAAKLTGLDARNAAVVAPHLKEIRRLLRILLRGRELDAD